MAIDGNWVDITSIVIVVLCVALRPLKAKKMTGSWRCTTRDLIVDGLSGSSIMPFLLMVGSVFSSQLLRAALETNKLYMAIGGLIGLVVVLGELVRIDAWGRPVSSGP